MNMSSTDSAVDESKALTKFHRKWIAPLGSRGVVSLAERDAQRRDGSGDDTFFIRRKETRMRPEDFNLGLSDPKQVVSALERQWEGTPMQPMARPFVKLARRFERYEQRADVSSNIYEMF